MRETIFAQATASGRAGIAIIRISGDDAGRQLDLLTVPRPRPRRASLRQLRDRDGEALDRAVVLWFPGPGSYTGEDCVELHLHAGPAVVEAVSEALRGAGARPAEPGEFTQRAFLTGRLDLIEAEGVADLIDAETQAQRRQALAQSEGSLSAIYGRWTERLKRRVAVQEALIDFPDETELADDGHSDADTASLARELESHLADGQRGEALRRGLTVTLVGAPNVGKSTLVNALVGRDVAIVSARAGTTRDLVEARVALEGVPVTFIDTAGLRESDDDVEQEGIRRAMRSAEQADLSIIVTEGDSRPPLTLNGPFLWVANKIDLIEPAAGAIGVSARTGQGMANLRSEIGQAVKQLTASNGLPMMTRSRHRGCLETTLTHLRASLSVREAELKGEELRLALHNLGRLTGAVGVDDILSEIFSTFCIGK